MENAKLGSIIVSGMLVLMALSIPQNVLADGTVSVADPTNDLSLQELSAPSAFYVGFIDAVEARVELGAGTYTFELTEASTPSDWLMSGWVPKFAKPLDQITISNVVYRWFIFDSSGNLLGWIHLRWANGFLRAGVFVDGLFSVPSSIAFSYDQTENSVTVTLSQNDFTGLFPSGTLWQGASFLLFGPPDAGLPSNVIFDRTQSAGLPS